MKHFDTPADRSLLFYAEKLDDLMTNWENEIVEFKEAKGGYDTDKIGRIYILCRWYVITYQLSRQACDKGNLVERWESRSHRGMVR